MKHYLSAILLLLLPPLVCSAGEDALLARARRAYEAGEWASAQALYGMVSSRRPDDFGATSRALTAGLMRGDTVSAATLVEQAMSAGAPLDSLMNSFEDEARALGRADIYVATLHRLVESLPYMRRPFNARLLNYYCFRQDADRIIEYSQLLLSGLPDTPRYLNTLAWGYALNGDMESAIATWRRSIKADPDNFEALVAAGNALVGTDPEQALAFLLHANDINPSPYLNQIIRRLLTSSNHN